MDLEAFGRVIRKQVGGSHLGQLAVARLGMMFCCASLVESLLNTADSPSRGASKNQVPELMICYLDLVAWY